MGQILFAIPLDDEKVELGGEQGPLLVVAPVVRIKYSVEDLLDMNGNFPLTIDEKWDVMPVAGSEVAL